MKNFLLPVAIILTAAACVDQPQTNRPVVSTQPAQPIQAVEPMTVSGGSGSQCLAVDVLANDGAFIRRGTAGTLDRSGGSDKFIVNGVSHDISGINYSVKSC